MVIGKKKAPRSVSSLGLTIEDYESLFHDKLFHVVASKDAVGVDAGGEVVDHNGAVACDLHLAHAAALHVDDGKSGGLLNAVADVDIGLGGVGESGEGSVGHDGFDGGTADCLEAYHHSAVHVAVGHAERVDARGFGKVGIDVHVDIEFVIRHIGKDGDGVGFETGFAHHTGAKGIDIDAVLFDGFHAENNALEVLVRLVDEMDAVAFVVGDEHGDIQGITTLIDVVLILETNLSLSAKQCKGS